MLHVRLHWFSGTSMLTHILSEWLSFLEIADFYVHVPFYQGTFVHVSVSETFKAFSWKHAPLSMQYFGLNISPLLLICPYSPCYFNKDVMNLLHRASWWISFSSPFSLRFSRYVYLQQFVLRSMAGNNKSQKDDATASELIKMIQMIIKPFD